MSICISVNITLISSGWTSLCPWLSLYQLCKKIYCPDSEVHGDNMGPTWVLSAPGGLHVGPINLLSGCALSIVHLSITMDCLVCWMNRRGWCRCGVWHLFIHQVDCLWHLLVALPLGRCHLVGSKVTLSSPMLTAKWTIKTYIDITCDCSFSLLQVIMHIYDLFLFSWNRN